MRLAAYRGGQGGDDFERRSLQSALYSGDEGHLDATLVGQFFLRHAYRLSRVLQCKSETLS
jgi:hypothetical protein